MPELNWPQRAILAAAGLAVILYAVNWQDALLYEQAWVLLAMFVVGVIFLLIAAKSPKGPRDGK